MKKLYALAFIAAMGLWGKGFGQYTAVNSGNWSSPITWAPGAIPSTNCQSCTVTINSGIIVQVDAHTEFSGTSVVTLLDGAQLVIGNSNASTINQGYNLLLDTIPGTSKIVLTTANSKIIATAAGTYDGIFVGPLGNSSIYQKVVGNKPSLFRGSSIIGTAPAAYGNTLSGPAVLTSGGTLPLLLTKFDAVMNDNTTYVTWSTAQESNLNDFQVLRSGDGATWQMIGTVPARGNSTVSVDYSFTDPSPLQGINYYRIKAVDNDLKFNLSEIKFIRGTFIKGVRIINPARNFLQVTFGSNLSSSLMLRLYNQNGQLLQQKAVSNSPGSTVLLPVGNYAQGVYTLSVRASDGTQSSYRVLINH